MVQFLTFPIANSPLSNIRITPSVRKASPKVTRPSPISENIVQISNFCNIIDIHYLLCMSVKLTDNILNSYPYRVPIMDERSCSRSAFGYATLVVAKELLFNNSAHAQSGSSCARRSLRHMPKSAGNKNSSTTETGHNS